MFRRIAVPLLLTMLLSGTMKAQDTPKITVTKLTDHIYRLSTQQSNYTTNTLAFVGDDGVLLVDTQSEEDAEALKEVVDSFGKGAPKYIINTHRHVEHIGGNAIFGDTPVIIAHELLPTKLRSGSFLFSEYPPATFPDITVSDSISLYFNGERIRIIAIPGSHDDNEIIVHFTGSKVVHLSSLVNGFNFPSVDHDGVVLKFPDCVARAMSLLPHDVIIVSGHNDNGTWDDLGTYHDMLIKTMAIVKNGLDAGKDVATLQREKVLDEWKAYAGSYVSVDDWIEELAKGFENQSSKDNRPTIYEPLYYAWKEKGAPAAVALYRQLKRDKGDQYAFGDGNLLVIGDKLLTKTKYQDAAEFLRLSLEEYPESSYGYYTTYDLAVCYKELGDKEQAIRYCEKSLELKPDFTAASTLLEELKKN
jgi:cyclase